MENVSVDLLRHVIESQHGGSGSFVQSVRVHKLPKAASLWDGIVHIFDLKNHPSATRAYAWASPIKGGTKPRYFAVLHQGAIKGPNEAVKAAAAAVQKWG